MPADDVRTSGSQGGGVPLDGGADVGLQPVVGNEVDRSSEDLLELVLQSGQPDETQASIQVHEEIDVALRPVVAAGGAAEQAEVGDAVPRRGVAKLLPAALDPLRPRGRGEPPG